MIDCLQFKIRNKDVRKPLLHHEFKNNLFRGDYDDRCSRKRRYDFPFIFIRKKVTEKVNWIGLYWISELKLYFKPSLYTKSLFLICFISLTIIGWSYLSGWKGTVYKRWEIRWFTHCRPFTSIFASHPTALLFHWGTLSVSKLISPFI